MALLRPTVQLLLREHARYKFEGPVLALGVPEIYATHAELAQWMRETAGKECPPLEGPQSLSTNDAGRRLRWISPSFFFKALGLEPVTTVDIPGSEHAPELVHDLNKPLPAEHLGRYGLIIDPGTIEHVFDMRTCLTNVSRALKPRGVVMHQVPVYMFNGGYYSINPNLLNDFYSKNGFSEIRTYIIMWDRYHPYVGKHRVYEYTAREMGMRHALSDYDQYRYSPMMMFVARKTSAVDEFVNPIQFEGHYHEAGAPSGRAVLVKSAATSVMSAVGSLVRVGLNLIGEDRTYPVLARIHRWRTLYRTRGQSYLL